MSSTLCPDAAEVRVLGHIAPEATGTRCGRWSPTNLRYSSCCPTAQLHAQIQGIYDTWRADGAAKAMGKFLAAWARHPARRQRHRAGNPRRTAEQDASHHRGAPCPPDPPDHAVPARHRRAAGGISGHHGRRRGHLPGGGSPAAAPHRLRTSSTRPWLSSPVITADSWPCQSDLPGIKNRCSTDGDGIENVPQITGQAGNPGLRHAGVSSSPITSRRLLATPYQAMSRDRPPGAATRLPARADLARALRRGFGIALDRTCRS
jgi:hypothetical protein